MAPEVLAGEIYGLPADIFSLGIIMWEMWHGRKVFSESGYSGVMTSFSSVKVITQKLIARVKKIHHMNSGSLLKHSNNWNGYSSVRFLIRYSHINERRKLEPKYLQGVHFSRGLSSLIYSIVQQYLFVSKRI